MTTTNKNSKSNAASATAVLLVAQMMFGSALVATSAVALADEAPVGGDAASERLSLDNQIERVLDDIDIRERREARIAEPQAKNEAKNAAIEKLGTDPTPAALAYGRKAAADDPLNFSLRLRMIDMLYAADLYEEADKTAAAITAERSLTPREGKRQNGAR